MIDAGLPLVRGLDIIASQHPNQKFKQIIVRVKEDVEAGSTFSDSLAKHPKVFSNLYTQLIKAGEAGGVLDVILQRLASYLEKMDSIKRKIKGAMIYPAIVISVAMYRPCDCNNIRRSRVRRDVQGYGDDPACFNTAGGRYQLFHET